ncbi:MAG: SusC/RagA family TonB-linked outer membrane protein, partial [Pedobacter sp.]
VPFSTEKISGRDNTAGILNGGVSPLMSINAADIESIEILKDADATAIYGSRGANGVVLITTKKSALGKTKFDLNVYQGIGKATPLKLLNTQEYLEMRREALANEGYTNSYPSDAYDINGTWDQNRYTDWQKVLIGSNANTTSLQGSISGGDERTQFLFTSGYRKETSVFPGDLGYQKGSFHLSVNHNSMNKRFTFNASFIGSADKNDQPSLDLTYEARRLQPNAPSIHNSDGSLNWENSTWNNPFASLLNSYNGSVKNIVGNTVFGYEILPGLKLKSSFGLNYIDLKEFNAYPSTAYNPAEGLTSARSEVRYSTGNTNSWIVEPQLSYDRKLGDHQLSLLLGVTYQDQRLEKVTTHYQNFPSNDLLHNLSSAAYINPYDFVKSIYKYNAVFGRINYNWNGKYIINLTARRDGSSRFGPGHQFANFGAIGAAWLFYKDEFVNNNLPFLSFGKLRASYGVTGSDQIGNYQFLDTYAIPEGNNIYQGMAGLAPSRLYNPDFAWESNKKLEVAMELGFINDRILFTFAYYNNRSSNQLVDYALPMTTGFTGVLSNLAATVQNTGIEAELNTINFTGRFNWTSSFNLTIPQNKLIAFPNIESSTYANTYVVGESIYIERLYEFTGVDPQMGIYTFRDFNGDG